MKTADTYGGVLDILERSEPPKIIADIVMLITCIIVARRIGNKPLDVKHYGNRHEWNPRNDTGYTAYCEVMRGLYQVHPKAESVLRRFKII